MTEKHELQLSKNIDVISFQIKQYEQTATQSFWEIGRRIKWVQDNDLAHGKYQQWLDSLGISRSTADRLKTIAAKLPHREEYNGKGWRLLYEIAQLPASERDKHHQLSNGKIKKPSEMTTREAEELRKQLNASKKQVEQLKKEANKPAKVVTKEVVPEDYEQLKQEATSRKNLTEALQKRGANQQKKITELEAKLKDSSTDNSRVRQLEQEVKNLTEQNLRTSQQAKALQQINHYIDNANELMMKNLAPLALSFSLDQFRDQPEVIDAMKQTVNRLTKITQQLNQQINGHNTIEGEVINHE